MLLYIHIHDNIQYTRVHVVSRDFRWQYFRESENEWYVRSGGNYEIHILIRNVIIHDYNELLRNSTSVGFSGLDLNSTTFEPVSNLIVG